MKSKSNSRKTYLVVIVVFIITVTVVKKFVSPPEFGSVEEKLEFYKNTNDNEWLIETYKTLVKQNPLNINYHYGLISSVFNGQNNRYEEKKHIKQLYKAKIGSANEEIKDIGYYCSGLFLAMEGSYEEALPFYFGVENIDMKYLHNSIGRAAYETGDLMLSKEHYLREIKVNGYLAGAYSNLATLYLKTEDVKSLGDLLKVKEARKYVPSVIQRSHYLTNFKMFRYFITVFGTTYANPDLTGLLGAFLIFLVYLVYFRKIDIYEPEKWKYIILIFLLGMVFAEFTFLLTDTLHIFTGFSINGNIVNDFMYCFIGIGAIEELVKIIPLFIFLKYTKEVNEPIDFILYAAISALGFAFAENIQYFTNYGIDIVIGRALTAVVFHMFLSALIAYGVVLANYHDSGKNKTAIFKYFIISALIHGTYDFWLINSSANRFGFLSMVLFIFCLTFFNTLIRNSLSNSDFYSDDLKLNTNRLQSYLIYSISGILLFQFLAVSFKYGGEAGAQSLRQSIVSGAYLLVFVTSGLGNIKIKKGSWEPFRVKLPTRNIHASDLLDEAISKQVEIFPFTKNRSLYQYLPNKGEITGRFEFDNVNDWYLVKLENEVYSEPFCYSHILIRPKKKENKLGVNDKEFAGVFLIKNCSFVHSPVKSRSEIHFVGWGILSFNSL